MLTPLVYSSKNNKFVSFTSKLPRDLLKLQKMLEKLKISYLLFIN